MEENRNAAESALPASAGLAHSFNGENGDESNMIRRFYRMAFIVTLIAGANAFVLLTILIGLASGGGGSGRGNGLTIYYLCWVGWALCCIGIGVLAQRRFWLAIACDGVTIPAVFVPDLREAVVKGPEMRVLFIFFALVLSTVGMGIRQWSLHRRR